MLVITRSLCISHAKLKTTEGGPMMCDGSHDFYFSICPIFLPIFRFGTVVFTPFSTIRTYWTANRQCEMIPLKNRGNYRNTSPELIFFVES